MTVTIREISTRCLCYPVVTQKKTQEVYHHKEITRPLEKAEQAIRAIAADHHTTIESVRLEIKQAMIARLLNPNPAASPLEKHPLQRRSAYAGGTHRLGSKSDIKRGRTVISFFCSLRILQQALNSKNEILDVCFELVRRVSCQVHI